MYTVNLMTREAAWKIAAWKYDGAYHVYSFSEEEETVRELLNGDYYCCFDADARLTGFYCCGESARIPTVENVYDDLYMDIGLGLAPSLCGQGIGQGFMEEGMAFIRKKFSVQDLRLTVACFNKRAVRLYERMGFVIVNKVEHQTTHDDYFIMVFLSKLHE